MNLLVPNLLISDDDRDLRETLGDLFRRRGMQVSLARDGDETLALVEQVRPHLVLLDFNMPKRSGLEVLHELQRVSWSAPCILMTAQLDESLVQQATQAAAYAVQPKPFSVSQIHDVVTRALQEIHGLWESN